MEYHGISTLHEKTLKQLKPSLCNKIKPHEKFLIQLDSLDVLSSSEIQEVKAQKTDLEKSSCIIDCIRKGTEKGYNDFLTALEETNQKHLAIEIRRAARGGLIVNSFNYN